MTRKNNTDISVPKLISRIATIVASTFTVLSIGVHTLNIELVNIIQLAVTTYAEIRVLLFKFLHLDFLFQCIANILQLNIDLVPPWQDVVVILFLYTMVQVVDARNGALNVKFAMLWRFFSGILGIIIAILLMSVFIKDGKFSLVLSIIIGVTIGLLIFRALHPFQLGFDVGWKALINEGRSRPETVDQYVVFFRDLVKTSSARSMFRKKISTVWKLTAWVLGLIIIYKAYRALSPEYYTPGSEFFFLICFMITICLFQVFMESKPEAPKGKHFKIRNPIHPHEYLYYSLTSGNYVIARELFKTTICVFGLAYSDHAWNHMLLIFS